MLRAALVGTGYWGPNLATSIERTGKAVVHWLCDANSDNLGSLAHDASIMCDFMSDAPVSVTAKGQSYLDPGIDDVVFATFVFDRGVVAHVHASWLNPNKARQITVVGSRKMAVCDDLDLRQSVRLYDKRVSLPPISEITGSFLQHKTLVVDSGAMIAVAQTKEPLLSEIDAFFDGIISGKQPPADGISGW